MGTKAAIHLQKFNLGQIGSNKINATNSVLFTNALLVLCFSFLCTQSIFKREPLYL